MTSERPDDTRRAPSTEPTASRRQWHRPTLTAYGPIGKLTQGGTGGRNDGSTGKRA